MSRQPDCLFILQLLYMPREKSINHDKTVTKKMTGAIFFDKIKHVKKKEKRKMIYINFLYFIIAILFFTGAPAAPGRVFTPGQNVLTILILIMGFWHYNRYKFTQLKLQLRDGEISLEKGKRLYNTRINVHMAIALALFAFEIFIFDLKYLILQIPIFGYSELFDNGMGLAIFMLHLVIVWYWGFRSIGDVLNLGRSARDYVRSNIKFNLGIVLFWLIFTVVYDVAKLVFPDTGIDYIMSTPVFREVFFGIFLVTLAIFAPVFVTRLWDCEPMPPSELKTKIIAFCRSQGVKFKEIMSWNALNKGLVTAGVMGLVAPFRYLMITPALMELLDDDEIMAVVSHEVGHVKKRHLTLYLVFFMGLIVLAGTLQDLVLDFFLTTPTGLAMVFPGEDIINMGVISLVSIPIILAFFILYFRFVFGYFMRNFERQADGFCFEVGVDPNLMVDSFKKLGAKLGDDGKKSNWHHYNLSQRIDFINKGMADPEVITRHSRKIKKRVVFFVLALLLFTAATYKGQPNLKRWAAIIEHQLEETPDDYRLYAAVGQIYYQLEEWKAAEKAYRYAAGLNDKQPDILNNLAWLLLTSEDESLRDPERALELAKDATEMAENAQFMDTLAEAYYQNKMYLEAYRAAKRALELASDNRSYFQTQYEKMKKALKEPEKRE